MAAEDSENKEESVTGSPKKGKPKTLLIVGGVILLFIIIGVPAGYLMIQNKGSDIEVAEGEEVLDEEKNTAEMKEPEEEELEEGEELLGAIFPLDTFVVNLKENSGMVRAQLQIEFKERDVPKKFLQKTVMARDMIISLLARKTKDELLTESGKAKVKEDIREIVNEVIKKDLAKKVYFSQFVIH
jgi:flagellar protein FliL